MANIGHLKARRRDVVMRGVELDEQMGGNGTFDQRMEMRQLTMRLSAIDREIEEATMGGTAMRAGLYGEGTSDPGDRLTPGEAFVQSSAYRSWIDSYPSGAPSFGDSRSDAVAVGRSMRAVLGLSDPTIRARTLIMLPDFERADRIGEFLGYPESRAFAELLIDCEEEPDAPGGARRDAAGSSRDASRTGSRRTHASLSSSYGEVRTGV